MRKSMKFQFNTFESEGEYDQIQIEFDAILVGDVDANKIQSNGQPQIKGNIKSREVVFTGLGYVEGNCTAKSMEFHSRSVITGDVKADRVILDGKLECQGNVEIDRLELNGTLDVKGTIKCNRVLGKGTIITDSLTVESINLEVASATKIERLDGNKVKLFAKEKTGMLSKLFSKGELPYIGEIDADKVSLTNVKSNTVTCSRIAVSGNCDIGKKIKRDPKFV